MIDIAKKHASASKPAASTEEVAAVPVEGEEAAAAPTATDVEEEAEDEEGEVDAATVEMRKGRAQKILKALGAR
jgi:hypothetical protein